MRLTMITETAVETDLAMAEVDFNRACGLIESGDKKEAYDIFTRLSKMRLPGELLHAARTASRILDPRNSTEQTARRLLELFPGQVIRVYDRDSGGSEEGLREVSKMRRELGIEERHFGS